MIPKKLVRDLIGNGDRMWGKIMRRQNVNNGAESVEAMRLEGEMRGFSGLVRLRCRALVNAFEVW
jgi:hypothetical protein